MADKKHLQRVETWLRMTGLLGTIFGMALAFERLFRAAGHIDPGVLAADIAMGLLLTLGAMAAVCIGVFVLRTMGK